MPLKFENWDGVTAPAIPSGWTVDSPAVTTSTFLGGVAARSGPNCIRVAATGGGAARRYCTWGTQDTNGGDVSVQASFNCSNNSDAIVYSLFGRCNASAFVRGSSTAYLWELDLINLTSTLSKDVAGTISALSTVSGISSLAPHVWYQATLTLLGTALTVSVQRLTDGFWLNSSHAFQSGQANVHSLTDSSVTGAGYAGLGMSARIDDAYSDDWTLSGAGAPSSASMAKTAGNDVLAGTVLTSVAASMSRAEGQDVFSGMASFTVGTMAKTEGHDAAAALGWCIVASMARTAGNDALAGAGTFSAAGAISKTAANDTMAAVGAFRASGSMAKTAGNDAASLAGNNTFIAAGTLLAGGHDAFAGIGTRSSSGSIGPTEHHDAFAGISALATSGSIARTESHDTSGLFSGDCVGSMAVTEGHDVMLAILGDVGYHVYSNAGIGDPIDYTVPIATTGQLTWTSGPLAFAGTWSFGVRAFDQCGEELNIDAAVTFTLDASGIDITNRPLAPVGLRSFPTRGGGVKLEWAQPPSTAAKAPIGFHVYYGISAVDYTTIRATVSANSALAGHFFTTIAGLTDGINYAFGVRAYNSVAEEQNTNIARVTADATGPSAVSSLTATAI